MVTPYFKSDDVTIFNADFRDVIEGLPQVDLIIADPPYGETSLAWDRWIKNFPECLRGRLMQHGSFWCFGSFRMFFEHAHEFSSWKIVQDLIWEKHNGSSMAADRFRRVHETAVQFYPRDVRWKDVYKSLVYVRGGAKKSVKRRQQPPHLRQIGSHFYQSEEGGKRLMRSVIYSRSAHGHATNPTQKPEPILMPLIEYSSRAGAVVLDPCMGSGSVLMAARKLGRSAVGIDIRESECETAAKRLSQQVMKFEG